MRVSRRVLAVLLFCCSLHQPASGPVTWVPGALSQAGMYALAASQPWWPDDWEDSFIPQGLLYGSSALGPVGLYSRHPGRALGLHALQGSAAALGYANHLHWDNSYLASSLQNLSVAAGMYGVYAGIENQEIRLTDLAASPVRLLGEPLVFGSAAGFFALGLFSGGEGVRLWESREVDILGDIYPREIGIPLYMVGEGVNMLATGIGEEALYRGVVYQGLSDELGGAWAKAIDMLLFPLMHLPQEIGMIESGEMAWGDAARNFALRSGITLLLDVAYDQGGLELSTALHSWINFASRMGTFLVSGGAD